MGAGHGLGRGPPPVSGSAAPRVVAVQGDLLGAAMGSQCADRLVELAATLVRRIPGIGSRPLGPGRERPHLAGAQHCHTSFTRRRSR